MTPKLFFQAFAKFAAGLVLVGALIFLPAGTFLYPQGWLLIGVLFVPMLFAGIVMMARSPELLKKRLNAGEKEKEQKAILILSAVMFTAAFVLAGLNFRFKWIAFPAWGSFAAAGVFLCGYLLYAEVMRENAYLSRTVEVQEGQKVIDTGLYGAVRHPMYLSTLVLFWSMPLVLGSPVSFGIMLLYLPVIMLRIRSEEKVLEQGLPGYADYKKRVRFRLIPRVW